MTEFKKGDIVRMTKGEPDKPGYRVEVRTVAEAPSARQEVDLYALQVHKKQGWTVELIERPAPPLPTRPNTLGWATDRGERRIVRRNDVGTWSVYDEDGFAYVVPDEDMSDFEEAVLIPKTLADRVMEWAGDEGGKWYAGGILERIADHLKGQGDD